MQLKKIKRAEKKGTESVMDEKFALLFKSMFQCGDVQINVRPTFLISTSKVLKIRKKRQQKYSKILGLGYVTTGRCNCSW